MLKKSLKILGYTLLTLLLILFLAPILFKGKLLAIAKEQINENILGETDFEDVSVSFFRNFPNAAVVVDNLYMKGYDVFEKDTLLSAEKIVVVVNPFSFLGDEWKITKILLDKPRIKALVNKDGKANWDIVKPGEETVTAENEEPFTFNLSLNKYEIKNGYVYYADQTMNVSTEIYNLNHTGTGNFTEANFILGTSTKADALTVVYEGVPYLSKVKTSIDVDLDINTDNMKIGFNTDKIHLNDLNLNTQGYFQLVNDSTYAMDIEFKAPSNDFKSILSMVPAIYMNDFDQIKTAGTLDLAGFVKGTMDPQSLPAFDVHLNVKDGFFQYPDLPQPVQNIQIAAAVQNATGEMDDTRIDVSNMHIEFGKDAFDFFLKFERPMTTQVVDLKALGKLNLASVTEFVKLEDGMTLRGWVDADLKAKGSLAAVQNNQAGDFYAEGFIQLGDIYFKAKEFPEAIQNTRAHIAVQNKGGAADLTSVQITNGHIEVGGDKIDFSASVKTPISDPNINAHLKGGFDLAKIHQFYTFEDGSTIQGYLNADLSTQLKQSQIEKEEYDKIAFDGLVDLKSFKMVTPDFKDGIIIENSNMKFNPSDVTLNTLKGKILSTSYDVKGNLKNVVGYALKDQTLSGNITAYANVVNADEWFEWMGEDTTTATEEEPMTVIPVPGNLNLSMNAVVDRLIYDKVEYKNIKGKVDVKNEAIKLTDFSMNAFDGSLAMTGSYSTLENKQTPDISFNYKLQNVDIQQTFKAYNTVQQLMPIGNFISGKLSSDLELTGKLGTDMFPLLNSLTGEGTLFLLEGVLSKFQPLESIASSLNINSLKSVTVKDIKNYFEFTNGKVLVKPFTVKLKDMEMEVGGMHGIDQSLDYVVNLKVPRALLGSGANNLIGNLSEQAAAKGINVNVSDTVKFKLNLGGKITQPTVKTDLASTTASVKDELKEQANEFIAEKKAVADSIIAEKKAAAKDTLNSIKEQVVKDATNALKDKLLGKDSTATKDSANTKEKVEDKAKGLLKGILNKKN
ncbi:AsmA-like C-terminal region-containing protein [Gynurincola endophyticus]|uniref:AsmA-like C-terminal region-containing protein n=1 Tax=Gynurincola endophyticus TaxID=2479004 RepID=UPI000F8D27B4|nr:AsmA-like C-terminal region-containing protein [Gynurincola endophyticus]